MVPTARNPKRVSGLVLFGGSRRGRDAMSGPGTQALLSLIEQGWDTSVESAADAWLGWPDDAERGLVADSFRTVGRLGRQPLRGQSCARPVGQISRSKHVSEDRCPEPGRRHGLFAIRRGLA
jgi:hypothetical protein